MKVIESNEKYVIYSEDGKRYICDARVFAQKYASDERLH